MPLNEPDPNGTSYALPFPTATVMGAPDPPERAKNSVNEQKHEQIAHLVHALMRHAVNSPEELGICVCLISTSRRPTFLVPEYEPRHVTATHRRVFVYATAAIVRIAK